MPSKSRVIVRDKGFKKLQRELKGASKSYTHVGVHKGEQTLDGVDLVSIAIANELGTDRIPERSFLRSTFDEQHRKLKVLGKKQYELVLEGKQSIQKALGLIGEYFQAQVVKKINDLRDPPNAPSTIEKKGSDNPLVDSGQLKQSIRHVEVIK